MDYTPIELVLLVLAAARVTRLVVADDIMEFARRWVALKSYRTGARGRAFGWLLDLVSCHWCAGLWVSAAVVLAWFQWSHVFVLQFAVVTLAIAQVQAMVNEREESRGGNTDA